MAYTKAVNGYAVELAGLALWLEVRLLAVFPSMAIALKRMRNESGGRGKRRKQMTVLTSSEQSRVDYISAKYDNAQGFCGQIAEEVQATIGFLICMCGLLSRVNAGSLQQSTLFQHLGFLQNPYP